MEDSNGIISSFAIVCANVSSTSLPSATRYHASLANSSRCSSSRKHHDALLSDGLNDPDANEVAMVVTPGFVILQRVSRTKNPHCWRGSRPEVTSDAVYVAAFSFPRFTLLRFHERTSQLLILYEQFADTLRFCHTSCESSGAKI